MGLCLRLRVSTDVEIGLNFLLAQHALVDLSSPHLLLGESSPEVGYHCWSAIAGEQSLCTRLCHHFYDDTELLVVAGIKTNLQV